jgi:hypothetical protein
MDYGLSIIDMIIYPIDMVILDLDMGYGHMIWEMTGLIRSSPISIWDILSLWGPRSGIAWYTTRLRSKVRGF